MSVFGDPSVEAALARACSAGVRLLGLTTVEDERALLVAEAVAERLDRTVHTWSAAAGVDGSGRDRELSGLLAQLAQRDDEALWLVYEAAAQLRGPTPLRMLRELARAAHGPIVILVEAELAGFPPVPELEVLALPLPERDQLGERLRRAARGLAAARPSLASALDATAEELAAAGLGLPLARFDRAVAEALAAESATAASVRACLVERRVADARGLGLERVETELDAPPIGYERALAWLRVRARAFAAGQTPARGVGLIAAPGCGLGLAARAAAEVLELPLVRPRSCLAHATDLGAASQRFVDALDRAAPVAVWLDDATPMALLDALASAPVRPHVFVLWTSSAAVAPPARWRDQLDAWFFVDLPDSAQRAELLTRLLPPELDPSPWRALAHAAEGRSYADLRLALDDARLHARALARPLTPSALEAALDAQPPTSAREAERLASLRRWACPLAHTRAPEPD